MSKLFEINSSGDVVCTEELQDHKIAKVHIDELQSKKAMAQNWKLDIFIDKEAFALVVKKISPSAAYKKGIFEWGVFALEVRFKGWPNLEEVGNVLLASFATPEAAFGSIEHIRAFIKHRYNLDLEIKREIYCEAYK